MASKLSLDERVKLLVADVLAEEREAGLEDRQENIDDIENAMIRIGDMVAREFGVQKLAEHTGHEPEDPPCPKCGCAGRKKGRLARELITRRGKVPITETKYYCPKCRQLFFPSDRAFGSGSEVSLHAADVSPDRVRFGPGR